MIEKGILPKGTQLTPINPLPKDVAKPGRRRAAVGHAQRRREEAVLAHGGGLRRLLRVHRRAGRPHHRLPGEDRAAREHDRLLLRRQRRVRRGQPERLGQREQVLQRLPGRARREHEVPGRARRPGHLRPLSDRMGRRRSPRRSRCSSATREYAGGTCDPLVISLAEGHQGAGRDPQPVPPLDRHRADDPRSLRAGDAEGLPRRRAVSRCRGVSMRYTFDAKPDAPTQKKRQYYAMLGTRGIWEDGWKAVARARAARPARATSTRTSGSSTTSTRTAPSRRTWPRSTPRSSRR